MKVKKLLLKKGFGYEELRALKLASFGHFKTQFLLM